jgi:chromatin segregation and condensation protein Rec8/ScpA/Scc1 (kleisin family)
MSIPLAELVERAHRGSVRPDAVALDVAVAEALVAVEGPEALAAALVAASWLLAWWLGAIVAEPETEAMEPPDARRERLLAQLALQRALAEAGQELARRLASRQGVPARAALVPEPPVGPIDPQALRTALRSIAERPRRTGGLVVPSSTVRIEEVARRVASEVVRERRTRFADLVGGWRPLEIVVAFVVVLEGYAAGALDLMVVAEALWVELVDDAALEVLLGRLEGHDERV